MKTSKSARKSKQATRAKKPTTKTTEPAKDAPICYRPTEAKREPLAPITGPIGPLPVAITIDHEIDRVALRKTAAGGDRWALSDLLMSGLAWDGGSEDALDLALSTLRRFSDELVTLHNALMFESPDTQRAAHVAYSMAMRAEMVENLCERIDEARKPLTHAKAPPAHEVAAACLALSGVPSATSTWDRLLRIAERIGVYVVHYDNENERERMDKVIAISKEHATRPGQHDWREMTRALYEYRPASEERYCTLTVWPFEADREATLARLLARAVAEREGFGETSEDWRRTFADMLLDRHAAKEAA